MISAKPLRVASCVAMVKETLFLSLKRNSFLSYFVRKFVQPLVSLFFLVPLYLSASTVEGFLIRRLSNSKAFTFISNKIEKIKNEGEM